MFRKIALATASALTLGLGAGASHAAGGAHERQITDVAFSFEGPFGTFDRNQLQRGLQVYTEACSACHGLQHVAIRALSEAGGPQLPEDQVRAYAQQFDIFDPALEDTRPRTPNDHFPESGMENAPDLSLMAKARAGFHGPYGRGLNQLFRGMGGAEYIASILTGYTGEEKEEAGVLLYENHTFPGGWIAMAPPLWGDDVTFADGSPTDLESISKDVSAFLMWTAEPKMMARKQAGFTGVLMLSILAVLLYLTNKRIWAPVKRAAKAKPAE
jgi:ubiquinol-cytochrome c reductase cytochrome c1 subunit